MTELKEKELKQFIAEYNKVRGNAVFFMENYWNKLHPDNPIVLTDDDKQLLYDRFRMIPVVKDLHAHIEQLKELRAKGYKDWEIDA